VRTCTNRPDNIRTPGYTTTVINPETNPHVEYLAHHWIVLAAPAFLPAVVVVGVVLYIAIRDRRARTPDNPKQPTDTAGDKDD
jgi:hypothetical protein